MSRAQLTAAAIAWVVLISVAIAVTVLAARNDTLPGDEAFTDELQSLEFPGESISDFIRAITETEVVLATGGATTLIFWLRGYRRQAVLLGTGLFLLALLQPLLKEIVDRPRPDPDLVERRAGFDSPSFPSGHVMSATFFYAALIYFSLNMPLGSLPRLLVLTASLVLLIMTPLASIWLGLHWPSDVIGSWLWCLVLLLPIAVLDQSESAE